MRNFFSLLKKLSAIWGILALHYPSRSFRKRPSSFVQFDQVENIHGPLFQNIFLIYFSPLSPQAEQKDNDEQFANHLQIYLSRTFTKAKKFLKIEEVEYLIYYIKFKMCPALFYVNSQHFLMLVLGCTLFPPIYKEIENWDFKCCSRLNFPIFPMMKKVKNWSFLDQAGKRQFS